MPSTDSKEPTSKPNVRKRSLSGKLRKPALFCLIALPILLLVLNGPGFRMIAQWAAGKAAATQGLVGHVDIDGTIWSGFSLTGNFSGGTEIVESVEIEEAAVDYRFLDLVTGAARMDWLDGVVLKNTTVAVRLPEAAEEAVEKEPDERVAATEFSPFWNLLETDMDITNLTVLLHQGDNATVIENVSLRSVPGQDGSLSVESIRIPEQEPVTSLTANLVKGKRSLRIESIQIGEIASLRFLSASEPEPGQFRFGAEVNYASATLVADFNTTGELSLGLRQGSALDLAKVVPDASGKVTDFALSFTGDFESPSTWDIDGNLVASDLALKGAELSTVALVIKDNAINLDALQSSAKLHLTASAPLERVETIDQLSEVPVDLALDLTVESIQTLLGEFAEKVPLVGSLSAEGQNIQLVGGTKVQSGSFLANSDSLIYRDVAISQFQIAANVESSNIVRLVADLGLDTENRVRLSGTFDTEALAYEAKVEGNVATVGRVAELADGFRGGAVLDWSGSGDLKAPHHRGSGTVILSSVRIGEGQPFDGSVKAGYDDSDVSLSQLDLTCGDVTVSGSGEWNGKTATLSGLSLRRGDSESLRASASIPLDLGVEGGFWAQPGPVSLDLTAGDLRADSITRFFASTPPVPGSLGGELSATGSFQALALNGDLTFIPQFDGASEDSALTMDIALGGDIARPSSWELQLDSVLSGLRFQEVDIENVSFVARTESTGRGRALLANLNANQSGARLVADMQLVLEGAASFADLAERPLEFDVDLDATDIGTVWNDFAPKDLQGFPVVGALTAKIEKVRLEKGSLASGRVSIASDSLAIADGNFESIAIHANVTEPDLLDGELAINLDEASHAAGTARFHLKEQTYSGDIDLVANLRSDGELKEMIGEREIASLLPKTTTLMWNGSGKVREKSHRGTIDLKADSVTLASGAEPLDVALSGEYSETAADFPVLKISSRPLDLNGSLTWKDYRLELSEWRGTSGGRDFLTIDGSLPLDPAKLKPTDYFAQTVPMELALNIDDLAMETVFDLLGREPPVRGDLSIELAAEGTPAKPALNADLSFDQIVVPQKEGSFEAGELKLTLDAEDDTADLSGVFSHPDINPLNITASLPFHPGGWASGERKVKEEALKASAKMDQSSLAFLPSQVPAIESIAGTLGIDATVSGTISAPEISGSGILDVDRLRLENRNAPSFYDIDLNARFAENKITIDRLHAIVAGGVVDGSGSATFAPGEEPLLDVSLTGSEVLVVRTPDVNVRTDVDLNLVGPFSQARLSGELGITNSRFFKNFDLFPIGLPTRNRSVLPTVERVPRGGGPAVADLDFGVDIEPFSNWPIDVRIYTKDPFLIRGNLAQSALEADLSIGGTLGVLNPNGYLEIAEGEFDLPFSDIDVEVGRVEFSPSTGFNGVIELKATAKADQYRINAYVYNRVLSPKWVLSSIPPMPSEDIMTLLATGTTRDELIGEGAGSVAASKAATLFFKNMRKANASADREPSVLDELEERTELEIGGVNPETGEQTFGGKIRLWKQLFFVGDVDSDSDYRALLKYVFRFK